MPLLPEPQEVEGWDLAREVTRSAVDTVKTTLRGSAKQPRAWMAVWLAATLGTTIVLAVTGAPLFAYVIPAAAMVLAATSSIRH
jgi:hypothetical protein